MPAKKRVTMKDVAKMAGVSIQTVSCVVNDKPGITDETRARVEAAIKALDYHPHTVARSLRTRQTQTLAIIVSDVSNPSLGIMSSAAEDYAHQFGYSLVLYNTHDDPEREAQCLDMAIENMVDGIVLVTAKGPLSKYASTVPSIAIDRIPEEYDGLSVTLDNIKAGQMAARHLLDLGHRCMGHISGPLTLQIAQERCRGFRETIKAHEANPDLCIVHEGTWSCQSGYVAMKHMLSHRPRPTAIFTANDRMALGAIHAINEAGLRVPDDISIVGLDNTEESAFFSPPLTTVENPFVELATLGVKHLLEVLAGKELPQKDIILDPILIMRQSTGAAARRLPT